MKRKNWKTVSAITLAGCLMLSGVLSGCNKGIHGPETNVDELTANPQAVVCLDGTEADYNQVAEFSFDLFDESLNETNPVISPVSAYIAMGMTGAGAAGVTQEEFSTIFGNAMIANADGMMDVLPEKEENLIVNIANSAWIDDEMEANPEWVALVDEYFESEIYQANLPEALQNINHWVKEKTEGLIETIFDQPLSEQARLVLVNAVYFKGKWVNPFEPESTRQELFYMDGRAMKDVDMMSSYGAYLPYIQGEGFDGVLLPYLEGNYAFVALKPTKGQTVREMYEGLTAESLKEALASKKDDTFMNLKLPKFQIEFERQMNQDFINMGLSSAFNYATADFSGLGSSVDGQNLYIEKVKQKAVIIVDEEGTEAAAVTAVDVECGSAMIMEEPLEVFFNEPFLYMIYDTETNIPLFMGILDEPLQD